VLRAAARRVALVALVLAGAFVWSATTVDVVAQAQDGEALDGFRAHEVPPELEDLTGKEPESKVWYHAERWWATMIPQGASDRHTIHQLAGTTWLDTGVVVEPSRDARGDALLVGDDLYIANRVTSTLFRARWDGARWVPRGDGPAALPAPPEVPALTITRDSRDLLWLTWVERDGVHVASAPDGDALTPEDWTVASLATLPGIGPFAVVGDEEISTITTLQADGRPSIAVLWSDQGERLLHVAMHRDAAPLDAWTLETVGRGLSREVDDHIDARSYAGSLYVVVKTGHTTSPTDPSSLIRLLVRSPGGRWTDHVVATVDEADTRPVASLEVSGGYVYVFTTRRPPEGGPRYVAYKRARLVDVAPGAGLVTPFGEEAVPFIRASSARSVRDATAPKANATPDSGILVLASSSRHYWWNRLDVADLPVVRTLHRDVVGAGSITSSPPRATLQRGTEVTLTATPARGWEFAGWSGDVRAAGNPLVVDADRDLRVTATFVEQPPAIRLGADSAAVAAPRHR
jgi:hypothetical protein